MSTRTLVFEGSMPGVTVVLYMYMSTTTMYVYVLLGMTYILQRKVPLFKPLDIKTSRLYRPYVFGAKYIMSL